MNQSLFNSLPDSALHALRIGGMVSIAPLYGSRSIPMRVKISLITLLSVVVAPIVPPAALPPMTGVEMVVILASEMLAGVAMGFVILMVFSAFMLGSQIIAMQMGLGFASLIDPQRGTQVPMVGQLYLICITLVFLSLDGHLELVRFLVRSFHVLPPGQVFADSGWLWSSISFADSMFSGAVTIALPAITTLLIVNLTFGVLTRSAPQLNIMTVGFPITIVSGFLIIWLTLESSVSQLHEHLVRAFALLN